MKARMMLFFAALYSLAGCAQNMPPVPNPSSPLISADSPWVKAYSPELHWRHGESFVLRPLAPEYNDLDFAAAQSSREHLQQTLQWGGWPSADATAEENLKDLERHIDEFENRVAYAYTVLTADESKCLGCVYINPIGKKGQPEYPRGCRVAFWVIESELANDLDKQLVASVLDLLEQTYPVDFAHFSLPIQNARGVAVLSGLGLTEIASPTETHRLFLWNNPASQTAQQ